MADPVRHVVAVTTHGCYDTDAPPAGGPFPVLLGFHGYSQNASHMREPLAAIDPAHAWLRVSVQGLHRFYARGGGVVASWMTSEDRELAIADNIAYAREVYGAVRDSFRIAPPVVVVGFSQGAAQAYRAALALGAACHGLIAVGGDVPPDIAPRASLLPPVLLGRGTGDTLYAAETNARDIATLRDAGVALEICAFEGGHEWAPSFSSAAAAWLDRRRQRPA